MSEILIFFRFQRNFTDIQSLHILSVWCFLNKMHDYVEIVRLSG